MFPHGFIFLVVIPLNLVKLGGLVSSESVFLVQNLDGICLVGQVCL
jgi:hypothetical protein